MKIENLVKKLPDMDINVALRLVTLHSILSHRNITVTDITDTLGVSKSSVYNVLSGNVTASTGMLDKIESAITQITDARGGVPYACCGWDSLGHYRELIEKGTIHNAE